MNTSEKEDFKERQIVATSIATSILYVILITIFAIAYAQSAHAASTSTVYDTFGTATEDFKSGIQIFNQIAGADFVNTPSWIWTPTSTTIVCEVHMSIFAAAGDFTVTDLLRIQQGSESVLSLPGIPGTFGLGSTQASSTEVTYLMAPCVQLQNAVAATFSLEPDPFPIFPLTITAGSSTQLYTVGFTPRSPYAGLYTVCQQQDNDVPCEFTTNSDYEPYMRISGSRGEAGDDLAVFSLAYLCPDVPTSTRDFGIFNPAVDMITYLFVPTCEDMLGARIALGALGSKVPFGYVSKSFDLLTGLQPGLSTSTFSVPIKVGSTTTVFPLYDPAQFEQQSGDAKYVFEKLRSVLIIFFWLTFLWWAYHRAMKQFETL